MSRDQSDLIPVQPGYTLSLQINVEQGESGGYELRCHGANGTSTIGPLRSLSLALDELAHWATSQAEWNRSEGR